MGRGGSPEEGDIRVNGGAWRRARLGEDTRGKGRSNYMCEREKHCERAGVEGIHTKVGRQMW